MANATVVKIPSETSTDFDDENITNVGSIALDEITSDSATSVTVTLGTDAGDDFIVGPSNKMVVEGDSGNVGIGTASPTAKLDVVGTLAIGGTATLAEAKSLSIGTPLLPTTDNTSTGLTAEMLAGGAIGAFETVCIHTVTGEVVISDSDAIGTMPVIGIAPAAINDTETGTILLQGFIRHDSWNWTIGGLLYASGATPGAMTQTAPSGTGDLVQVVGVALSDDVVYFNPSLTMVEVA
tara:strand:+ start:1302 stop:2015 length:714 start_codon:yes stop_codon:yes gene_type:complete